ncbi:MULTISPECIES: response regulator [unclassified Pseudomonas]|uniref:response regulator n=1 Tax=unclassified Pseudomonas TaxID=196821 RepID=UPI000BDB8CBA|nr:MULTISPECIES: response regulator [unclassified Pseudomonas]PVZ15550.1 chemosensory pili system protein ChpA (sensor histidine kinase/response regulator) [Pseudomonas sp. URIL14HWK12:I12]PVZ24924.1 chemosensory pili system protein ChpA (sensor histidine kinase/response regulator) [Pseudomonas sp. URIL14HWK12:I10]PVZ34770.1 chemosensory pili system protein ChpA (sensor histidine kinase/response regulator) [Pseudomonas sp. URIL14HWK12:I11]SNZ09246.1 chemosensory pili system protein ChpA (sensor
MNAAVDFVGLEWVRRALIDGLAPARQALLAADPAPARQWLEQARGAMRLLELESAGALLEALGPLDDQQPAVQSLLLRVMDQLPDWLERVHRARRDLPELTLALLTEARGLRSGAAAATPVLPPELAGKLEAGSRDALRAVVQALCAELVRHHESLDAWLKAPEQGAQALGKRLPALRQVADTLAVLGFEQPRRLILDQLNVLQAFVQGQRAPDEASLLDVASALLYIEATLSGMVGPEPASVEDSGPSTDIDEIHRLVIRETLAGLERFRAGAEGAWAAGWPPAECQALAELLHPLAGALAMIPLAAVAAPLEAVARWLAQAPRRVMAEALAEVICALEYHLERLLLDPEGPHQPSLTRAERALEALRQGISTAPAAPATAPEPVPASASLQAIFRDEAQGYLAVLQRWLASPEAVPGHALHAALHTLKGSASMAGASTLSEVAAALDRVAQHAAPDLPEARALFEQGAVQIEHLLAGEPAEQAQAVVDRASALLGGSNATPPSAAQAFMRAHMDQVLDSEATLRAWAGQPRSRQQLGTLLDELTELAQGAHEAGLPAVDQLCEALLDVYGAVEEGSLPVNEAFFECLGRGHEALIDQFDQLAAGQAVEPAPLMLRELRGLLDQALPPDALGRVAEGQAQVLPALEPEAPDPDEGRTDQELLQVFLDEGFDIVESAGEALLRWEAEPGNTLEVENLLRDLHTLKGGARMVEVAPIGDLAHELETLYQRLAAGTLLPSAGLFKLLQKGHDRVGLMLDALRSGQPVQADPALIARMNGFGLAHAPRGGAQSPRLEPAPAVMERGPVDMVKVTALVLEELGDLAGEAAIARGRVEQQVNDSRSALYEMDMTLQRMRDHLLRLDSETQAGQRDHSQESTAYAEFDPLEMDRHSQLQQLTRGLFEAVSDLLDLKDTLDERNHEAQALLAHQSRVSSQLQEGLMRTRMVPFERVLPRLQRVVRQVAEELGKEVIFEAGHAEAEMDRTVLERMVAPLEHMLRNAVDHGLEPAAVRRAAGKPESGLISLSVSHEGGEVVIELADDGAGVPLDAVRHKAAMRGLLAAGSDMSDHDVMQFILQPGFSTAEKITQISGRGLGMDVVHEEVKQLGGSMTIDSRRGVGARFQIRLPLSVSVNRALLVQCNDELYAVPLNSVEGIVRVGPSELDAHYRHTPPVYRYGGINHDLRYLGQLLTGQERPTLLSQEHALPVLLVRAHEHQVAVQVDAITGSRDIVVKSLGPQFVAVPGLNGATILGDGRVVLILDLLGLIRAQQLRHGPARPAEARAEPAPARPRRVLVVDDSVTVRKVTSRLLERHGMHVSTARDGVEAVEHMEEQRPDILLLDIEMPRMDGYEVATWVRRDSRLKHLPIIMITSRTGEKHRDRAMAIGVNEYLGKPFQEPQLLACIEKWSPRHA